MIELLIAVAVFAVVGVAFLAAVFVLTNRLEDRRR